MDDEAEKIDPEAAVLEKYGVSMPKWRKKAVKGGHIQVRNFTVREYTEMDETVKWLCKDPEYVMKFGVYLSYCDILRSRGMCGKKDPPMRDDGTERWKYSVMSNFAKGMVGYVYHDMCCDANAVLGEGHADGYWVYLDKPYSDIDHMKVGKAIINLDEIWAVVSDGIHDWEGRCAEREESFIRNRTYPCDRCRCGIHPSSGSRFDPFENLLHCRECAETCADHWNRRKRK